MHIRFFFSQQIIKFVSLTDGNWRSRYRFNSFVMLLYLYFTIILFYCFHLYKSELSKGYRSNRRLQTLGGNTLSVMRDISIRTDFTAAFSGFSMNSTCRFVDCWSSNVYSSVIAKAGNRFFRISDFEKFFAMIWCKFGTKGFLQIPLCVGEGRVHFEYNIFRSKPLSL